MKSSSGSMWSMRSVSDSSWREDADWPSQARPPGFHNDLGLFLVFVGEFVVVWDVEEVVPRCTLSALPTPQVGALADVVVLDLRKSSRIRAAMKRHMPGG